jgi:hypothetical protein
VQVVSVDVTEDCIELFDDGVLEVAGEIENVEMTKAKARTLMPTRFLIRSVIAVSS